MSVQLNTISLPDFTDLVDKFFEKNVEPIDNNIMVTSGLVKVERVPLGTGDTRRYTQIDREEYASTKAE